MGLFFFKISFLCVQEAASGEVSLPSKFPFLCLQEAASGEVSHFSPPRTAFRTPGGADRHLAQPSAGWYVLSWHDEAILIDRTNLIFKRNFTKIVYFYILTKPKACMTHSFAILTLIDNFVSYSNPNG